MAQSVEFDAGLHEYRVDGRRIPSVTQVLEAMNFCDPTWYTEQSRLRGTMVHRGIELYTEGALPADHGIAELEPYLDAWIEFSDTVGLEVEESEIRLYSPMHRFAGTIDVLGTMRIDGARVPVVLDIKTGTRQPWWPLQLAGYQQLAFERDRLYRRRYDIQLADSTYRLWPEARRDDWIVFRAALTCWWWQQAR